MKIIGVEETIFPRIDFFTGIFSINPKVTFTEHEAEIMMYILYAVRDECIEDKIKSKSIEHANIVISDDGSYEFVITKEDDNSVNHERHPLGVFFSTRK